MRERVFATHPHCTKPVTQACLLFVVDHVIPNTDRVRHLCRCCCCPTIRQCCPLLRFFCVRPRFGVMLASFLFHSSVGATSSRCNIRFTLHLLLPVILAAMEGVFFVNGVQLSYHRFLCLRLFVSDPNFFIYFPVGCFGFDLAFWVVRFLLP